MDRSPIAKHMYGHITNITFILNIVNIILIDNTEGLLNLLCSTEFRAIRLVLLL